MTVIGEQLRPGGAPRPVPGLGDEAVSICQALLRFDTTNPPGREQAAAEYLARQLAEVGYQPQLLCAAPERTNLVVRWPGTGAARPLLLTAHLDVVEARGERWRYPPFSGAIAEGCLWGRGAIDMKHMAAMCTAVMRRLARDRARLDRDVIFAAVADEEAGCDLGSRWLVENHGELVAAEYALGEVGGFSMHVGRHTFYPVQVAEKGICWVRARTRGEPGHGSMPRPDSAVVRLAAAVARLGARRLPSHDNPHLSDFLRAVLARQPALVRPLASALLHPRLLPGLLERLPDASLRRSLLALTGNTATPTVLRAGSKINVIADSAEVEIDGRLLPGQSEGDFLRELAAVLGPDIELEVIRSSPAVVTEPVSSPLYQAIERQIRRREPEATVVPYMIPGFTDAKYFSQTGARWYGFAPVKLERGSGLRFADMFHGENERIPLDGLRWGAELLHDVVRDFAATRPPGQ
jgi:acetylornithine deacetylase/succinyl-diaminopimelate desuccinylase-like protein